MSIAERLRLQLGPSVGVAAVLAAAHAVAGVAIWITPLPLAVALSGTGVVLVSLVSTVRRHAFRHVRGALVELDIREDCTVSARLRGEEGWGEYRIEASSFVSAVITVVNLRSESGRRRVSALIAGDTLDPERFRQLRVWLRWRCGKAT